jgi:hypothetical protein
MLHQGRVLQLQAKKEIQEKIKIAENDPTSSPKYIQELRDMLEKVERAELEKLYQYARLE